MPEAFLRFYGMLTDLLDPNIRGRRTQVARFDVSPSLKALIESFGVPHTEIDLTVVNGDAAELSRAVRDGDRIAVYPAFHELAVREPAGAAPLHFVLDVHAGKLARWLRMLGFDALWRNDAADADLAQISAAEDRILLTRDRGLLMRNEVRRGYWLRFTDPKQQLAEVIERYDLLPRALPFSRCLECNGTLKAVSKESIAAPAGVLARHEEFRRCGGCRRVFWKGSHYERMTRLIEMARSAATRSGDRTSN